METMEANFSAKDVMALRQKTGMPMMECKKALTAANGDMDAAEQQMREDAKGKMDARSERSTGEGRLGVVIDGSNAAIIEIRTETDFTARNPEFIAMVEEIAKMAIQQPAGELTATEAMKERIDDVRLTTKENMSFARGEKLEGDAFGSYLHFDGKKAAVIQIQGAADAETLAGVCMHIVAHVPAPVGVGVDDVPAELIENIRTEAIKAAEEAGKNAEIAQKIADGKVRKYLEGNTLLDQIYVKDPDGKKAVKDVLPAGATVTRFLRYVVGVE